MQITLENTLSMNRITGNYFKFASLIDSNKSFQVLVLECAKNTTSNPSSLSLSFMDTNDCLRPFAKNSEANFLSPNLPQDSTKSSSRGIFDGNCGKSFFKIRICQI